MKTFKYAGEYDISDLKLFTASGNVIRLDGLYQSLDIYENMFSNKGPLLGAAGRLIGQMMIDQQGDAMFKYAQDNNLLRGLGGTYQGPLQRGPYRYP